MKNSKSLLWTFIKSTVVNCLIVIAFSGLFNGSLGLINQYTGSMVHCS